MSRRTVLIAFGAAALLLVLWFMLLWSPQGAKLSEANERRDVAAAENVTLESRLARLRAAQERAPDLQADVEKLRRAVPDDPELAQFILDANEIASLSGVDFLSISPGVPAPGIGGLPASISLAISVTGAYSSALDYLDRLNDLPRVVVVDNLALSPQSDSGDLAITVSARMFTTTVPGAAPVTTTTIAPPGSPTTTTTAPGATP